MKDVRFRVNAALSDAGLSGSSYALELVRGLNHQPKNDFKLS